MTAIFSGGIAYEFYDCSPPAAPATPGTRIGKWGYGLVREAGDGEGEGQGVGADLVCVGRGLTKLPDFLSLKARLKQVCELDGMPIFQRRLSEETIDEDEEDEEEEGVTRVEIAMGKTKRELPPLSAHWRAGYALPSVADWKGVRRGLEEKMWIEVDAEEVHVSEIGLDGGSPRLVRA